MFNSKTLTPTDTQLIGKTDFDSKNKINVRNINQQRIVRPANR